MAQENKNYINGVFLKDRWVKEDGSSRIIGMGINKEEFIKQLSNLKADGRGMINLTISTQKSDPEKYSLFVDDFKPKNSAPATKNTYPSKPSATKKKEVPVEDDSDDLPF
jgi:hypothetical protein